MRNGFGKPVDSAFEDRWISMHVLMIERKTGCIKAEKCNFNFYGVRVISEK